MATGVVGGEKLLHPYYNVERIRINKNNDEEDEEEYVVTRKRCYMGNKERIS